MAAVVLCRELMGENFSANFSSLPIFRWVCVQANRLGNKFVDRRTGKDEQRTVKSLFVCSVRGEQIHSLIPCVSKTKREGEGGRRRKEKRGLEVLDLNY